MADDTNLSIDDIIAVFREFDGVYQKEMVDTAISRREEIIPRLIEVLRQVIADPDAYIKDQDLYDHIYALMLLGHFKAGEAHDTVIELFSLPGSIPQDLFGDIVIEDLPVILVNTCGGSLALIRDLVLNREANVHVRISAAKAMGYAVAADVAPRKEVVDFLGTLFTGGEAEEGSDFWTMVATVNAELHPEENMAVIRQAFERGLISPRMMGLDDFERIMQAERQAMLDRLRAELERDSLDDLHAVMQGWTCFNSELELLPASEPADLYASGMYGRTAPSTSSRKEKAQKKKKRRQAKAARRRNRR